MNFLFKIFPLILFLILFSCKPVVKELKLEFDGITLKSLVQKSLQGGLESNNRLKGLLTFISSDFDTYNKIFIDSITINDTKFYSILIENRNPIYNLFAIIDNKMNLLLKDESLNGYLNSNWKKSGRKIFATVNESFKSKDIVGLNRISYYEVDSLVSALVFRQFIQIKTPELEANQNLISFSDTVINTEITQSNSKKPEKDSFRFDVSINKYLSNQNKFDKIINSVIASIKSKPAESQITGVESIQNMLGFKIDSNSTDSSNLININDFDIKLNNQWRKLGNYTIVNPLKREVKGFKFINTRVGAEISLFKLSVSDSIENYFDKALLTIDNTNNIKSSEEFNDSRNTSKLFEFNCPSKKIILILSAPKTTFENYKDIYNNIIKSFKIHC
jgi:hypothetical protein